MVDSGGRCWAARLVLATQPSRQLGVTKFFFLVSLLMLFMLTWVSITSSEGFFTLYGRPME